MAVSTKHKVIFGFIWGTVIFVAVAVVSIRGISTSMDLFKYYVQVATFSCATSDMEGYMFGALYKTNQFSIAPDKDKGKQVIDSFNIVTTRTNDALQTASLPKHIDMTKELLEKYIPDFKSQTSTYVDKFLIVNDLMTNTLPAKTEVLLDVITMAASQARDARVIDADSAYIQLRKTFLTLDKNLILYTIYQNKNSKNMITMQIEAINTGLAALDKISGLDRVGYNKVSAAFKDYFDTCDKIMSSMDDILKTVDARNAMLAPMFVDLQTINDESTDLQTRAGEALTDQNHKDLKKIVVIIVIGLLLSISSMVIIARGFARTLKAMGNYADDIGKGNFVSKLLLHEPGELGAVMNSMRNIPVILGSVIAKYKELGNKVTQGYLSQRAEASDLSGEYSELVKGTNSLLNSFGSLLDLVPAMVMLYDSDYTVTYMNKSAQDTLGNLLGKKCPDTLRTPLEGTNPQKLPEADLLRDGRQVHVSISSTPNIDPQGKIIGAISVLSDLTGIHEAYTIMTQVANEADLCAQRMVTAAEELSVQVEETTKGSEIQRDQITSTATAMEEMNATVIDVARNAGDASKQSDDTRNKARDGSELVNSLVKNINQVNTIASTLHNDMQELGKQAEAIGGVMNVISDIADQTNLLALNAAIEAARAGEAGRGFAVVADEVRKLAENTMKATSEVGTSIKAIQESAQQNIKNVNDAVISVTDANKMAEASGQALRDIVNLANANSQLISGIATASEEQSATSEEINRSVSSIHQVINQTTSGMLESSSAVRELSSVAHDLKQLLGKLTEVANHSSQS